MVGGLPLDGDAMRCDKRRRRAESLLGLHFLIYSILSAVRKVMILNTARKGDKRQRSNLAQLAVVYIYIYYIYNISPSSVARLIMSM